eukprot:89995-Chlamydomonas_euryale.AAC.2
MSTLVTRRTHGAVVQLGTDYALCASVGDAHCNEQVFVWTRWGHKQQQPDICVNTEGTQAAAT